ncbi:MAG: outer membrane beta-barrel protein [Polyangiales bacterium]
MRFFVWMIVVGFAGTASAQTLPPALRVGGYVEAFWQWNFARPRNGITNFRAFDNRHDTFTLSNVALDVGWDDGHVIARVVGQVGHTPSTYYLAEPARDGSDGANATDAAMWKYLQQAYLGYRFELAGRTALVEAGLFLSPIGPESMAVYQNVNYSRSVLFYALPFYHTGARATYEVGKAWKLSLAALNGWNSVVDNNRRKSLAAQAVYTREGLTMSLLYFGGVERDDTWRNLFDAHATWQPVDTLALVAHANAGFERQGTRWAGGALTARVMPWEMWSFAVRGDALGGDRTGLFYPASRVASATATIDLHPVDHISFRLEYRHDQASAPIYFRERRTTRRGDTLTVGATAWF